MNGAEPWGTAPIQIRDRRQPGWAWFDYAVIDEYGARIGADGIAVYMVLCRHANHATQSAWPSLRTIEAKVHLSRHRVIAVLALLETEGLIQKVSRPGQQSNEYLLLAAGGAPHAPGGAPHAPGGAPHAPEQDPITRSNNKIKELEREAPAPAAPSLSLLFTLDDFTTATASVPGIHTINLAEQHAALLDAITAGHRKQPKTQAGWIADACIWARRAVAWAATHPPKEVPAHGPDSTSRHAADSQPPPVDDGGAAFQQRLAGLLERKRAAHPAPDAGRPAAL